MARLLWAFLRALASVAWRRASVGAKRPSWPFGFEVLVEALRLHTRWLAALPTPALRRAAEQLTRDKLTQGKMNSIPVPLPPLREQEAIVSFIDRKTTPIDALISRKERLLELLQEKRQALITQAVTKGLDPTAPMKDSGIASIGAVPAVQQMNRNIGLVRYQKYGDELLLLELVNAVKASVPGARRYFFILQIAQIRQRAWGSSGYSVLRSCRIVSALE